MNTSYVERIIELCKANGITRFKSKDLDLRFGGAPAQTQTKPIPLQAIPPKTDEIPHHLNEVRNLMKLSPEELVDRMFPDYSQGPEQIQKEG